jgi:hypothetical protein
LIITTGFTDLSAEAHRNQTAALLATTNLLDANGTPVNLQTLGGVQSGFYHTGGAALTGTLSAGRAIIPSTTHDQGAYVVTMTEPESFALEPGDGIYNRIDLVYLAIDEVPEPAPEPVEGEPAPEPVYVPGASLKIIKGVGVTGTTKPVIPNPPPGVSALPLWAIQINAATTVATGYAAAQVNDRRKRLLLANQDRQPFAMACGTVNVSMRTTSYYGSAGITFPPGRFRVPPIVTVSLANAPAGSGNVSPRAINPTPTGASVYCYTADLKGADVNHTAVVNWTAIQMAEDTAAG